METETDRKETLMINNFIIIAGILVIIISFTLMPASLLPTTVHAQVGLDPTHIESVTSTYDALLKAPMIISQAAIVGGVFNHVFLHRVLRSRIQPNYKNNVQVDSSSSSLQPLRRLFFLLVICSLTILVTASSLIYLQTISLSSELGLDVSTTFTILTSTSVGPVWILRIITSSIIVISSILYYILEKKKIKRTTEGEEHHTYSKQKKRNLNLHIVLLYVIILSGAISVFSNSVVSHSAALSFLPSLAISINWLHFMAVSIWVGGVFYISVILLVTIRSIVNVTEPVNQQYETNKIRNTYFLAVLLPYFSLIATISLGIIGVTGLYMAWIHLHTAGALFDTMYGNVLIIKLSAILPMIILGGYHQFRLHDSLVLVAKIGRGEKKSNDNKRSSAANTSGSSNSLQADPFAKFSKTIRIESFIGIGILFITSFLTITSPPSMSMAENSNLNGSATTTTENEMPSFDAFAILAIILSGAVLTGSIVSFVRSKQEIKKTLDSLQANH